MLVKKYFNDIQNDKQSICICNALSLCHLAAKNNAQEIMRSLIRNGGDLSKQVIGRLNIHICDNNICKY